MNLEIQLEWCRHWIREQLGMTANGSIVAFVDDRIGNQEPFSGPMIDALRTLAIESRWHFSRLQCVLISVVRGSSTKKHSLDPSLCGVMDQQIWVDNATDLCGWIGASNSFFILETTPPQNDNSRKIGPHPTERRTNSLLEAIGKVGNGFRKPWNAIDRNHPKGSLENLDWERLHQPSPTPNLTDNPYASISFADAVRILEQSFGKQKAHSSPEFKENSGFRQAG